jgi:hypothetical protein
VAEDSRTLFRLRRLGKPVAQRLRPDQVLTDLTDAEWDCLALRRIMQPIEKAANALTLKEYVSLRCGAAP